MNPWSTVWDDSHDTGFLLQFRTGSPSWVDIRVFRAITFGPSIGYGYDTDDATPDLNVAPQFAHGSCKHDGGWCARVEFCDHARGMAVEVNPRALASLFAAIADNLPESDS